MYYMVQIEVQPLPGDWPSSKGDELRKKEVEKVVGYMREGKLVSPLMRVPGRNANFGVWKADSPEELDRTLRALPLHPFMLLQVTPLMAHPSENVYKETYGEMIAFGGFSDG